VIVDEARLVSEMLDNQLAGNAAMAQMAASSIWSKTGQREFKKAIRKLTDHG